VDIHKGREVVILIVAVVKATFTTMVRTEAPKGMDIAAVVHGTASKLVVPSAHTSMGVVKARKGSTHEFLFIRIALNKEDRAVSKDDLVRKFKMVKETGGVVGTDSNTKGGALIDTGKVASFNVRREGVMVEDPERRGGGSGRRGSRARRTGESSKLGGEIGGMGVHTGGNSSGKARREIGAEVGNGGLKVGGSDTTNRGTNGGSGASGGCKGGGGDAIPVAIIHRAGGEIKVKMRDRDKEGNRGDLGREGVAKEVDHVRTSEAAIVLLAVGSNGAGDTNGDRSGGDGNADVVGKGGSPNGNRGNDFMDNVMANKIHKVSVGEDIGPGGRIHKESRRVSKRSRVERVHLSGSFREVGVITKADTEVRNRGEISHDRQGEGARKQENWGADSKAVKAQKQQQKL